jgi:hypothetical protein
MGRETCGTKPRGRRGDIRNHIDSSNVLGETIGGALAREFCSGGVGSEAHAIVETMRRVGINATRRAGLNPLYARQFVGWAISLAVD